jgi:hypothetical protein
MEVCRQTPTLFVALEMLDDPPSVELLATHECLHVAHYCCCRYCCRLGRS